jgi:hypothetical protein
MLSGFRLKKKLKKKKHNPVDAEFHDELKPI